MKKKKTSSKVWDLVDDADECWIDWRFSIYTDVEFYAMKLYKAVSEYHYYRLKKLS